MIGKIVSIWFLVEEKNINIGSKRGLAERW
jgi:hypothetical protein